MQLRLYVGFCIHARITTEIWGLGGILSAIRLYKLYLTIAPCCIVKTAGGLILAVFCTREACGLVSRPDKPRDVLRIRRIQLVAVPVVGRRAKLHKEAKPITGARNLWLPPCFPPLLDLLLSATSLNIMSSISHLNGNRRGRPSLNTIT